MNGDGGNYPILILGAPRTTDRANLGGGPGGARRPERRRQVERITPRFEILQRSFAARSAELRPGIVGAEPEQVIVLETVGTVADFINAVRRIEGMEFLGEFDEDDIPADEDFYHESDPDKQLSGTVYLVLTNQEAMDELTRLWRRFQESPDEPWDYGLTKFRELFDLLRDIRPWGPEDRLQGTGVLEDWRARVAEDVESVPVEIELWYRIDPDQREIAQRQVTAELEAAEGELVTSVVVSEIRYHALLARLPIGVVETLLNDGEGIRLVRSDSVMFLRPVGQGVVMWSAEEGLSSVEVEATELDDVDPVLALLDGVPLEQHDALTGRLRVDDPDDFASIAPAARRNHGTAMASLIIHGDLTAPEEPLISPIYIRPLLAPGPDWVGHSPETIPEDQLPIDLTLRAIRRIFEGEGDQPPAAPTVRIINLSVGDRTPFTQMMSPWARLLDWVAWRYQVVIVVSAGNHWDGLDIELDEDGFSNATGEEIQSVVLEFLAGQMVHRRLLPPSEGTNVLTVGASHSDESVVEQTGPARELIDSEVLAAPYSALGMGYRRAIKPDILAPGGRVLYNPTATDGGVRITPVEAPTRPPGHRVASPLGPPGTRSGTAYSAGTSNAAAIVSHRAVKLHQVLTELRTAANVEFLAHDGVMASAIRALLVHGAAMGDALDVIRAVFAETVDPQKMREFATRFVGYGAVGRDLVSSTASRATMLGGGMLGAEEAHVYDVPLPPGLSGIAGERRLTATLAWLTPLNPRDRRYRRAKMWISPPGEYLTVKRSEADWQAARRGTLQHEVFVGSQADVYDDGDSLSIAVNCAEHAGRLESDVPYALLISLEAAPELEVEIFAEISERIRPPVPVRPNP